MFKDLKEGQTNYCTHENKTPCGLCSKCIKGLKKASKRIFGRIKPPLKSSKKITQTSKDGSIEITKSMKIKGRSVDYATFWDDIDERIEIIAGKYTQKENRNIAIAVMAELIGWIENKISNY